MQQLINQNLSRTYTPLNTNSVRFTQSDRSAKQTFTKSKTIKLPNVVSTVHLLSIQEIQDINSKEMVIQINSSRFSENSLFSPRNLDFEFKVDSQKMLELRLKLKNDISQLQVCMQKVINLKNQLADHLDAIQNQRAQHQKLLMQINNQ